MSYILVKTQIPLLVDKDLINELSTSNKVSVCNFVLFTQQNKYYILAFFIISCLIILHYKNRKRRLRKLRSLGLRE